VLRRVKEKEARWRRKGKRPRHLNALHRFLNGNDDLTFGGGGATVEKIANGISLPVVFAMCDCAHHVDLLQVTSQDIEDKAEFRDGLA
jgi:hypothetical protein